MSQKVSITFDYVLGSLSISFLFPVDGGRPVTVDKTYSVSSSFVLSDFVSLDTNNYTFIVDSSKTPIIKFEEDTQITIENIIYSDAFKTAFPSIFGGVSGVSSSCSFDDTNILNAIASLRAEIETRFGGLFTRLDTLDASVKSISISGVSPMVDFMDLNGNCGSYANGSRVTVQGVEGIYTVQSSFLGWSVPLDGHLVLCYNLLGDNNKKIKAPHLYVRLYVEKKD